MKYPFFLQALLAGNIVLLVYTCIRVFRRLIKHDLFFVSLEDFFFWVWAGLYLFVKIYDTSDGSIRWFFTIGVGGLGEFCSFFVLHFFCLRWGKNCLPGFVKKTKNLLINQRKKGNITILGQKIDL